MTASSGEKRARLLSLLALPVLLGAAFAVNARRNIADHVEQIETRVRPAAGQTHAGAVWQVEKVRLIGDGRDTKVTFPGQMRLVIVQLKATAREAIGERWAQCRFTLVDDQGRRWLPSTRRSRETSAATSTGKPRRSTVAVSPRCIRRRKTAA
jgi:hypothetical protein